MAGIVVGRARIGAAMVGLCLCACGVDGEPRELGPDGRSGDGLEFLRGDANGDGVLTKADIAAIGVHLYAADALPCEDAADFDDNGVIEFADAIRIFEHIEGRLTADKYPETGFPEPAPDLTEDDLTCLAYDRALRPSMRAWS